MIISNDNSTILMRLCANLDLGKREKWELKRLLRVQTPAHVEHWFFTFRSLVQVHPEALSEKFNSLNYVPTWYITKSITLWLYIW